MPRLFVAVTLVAAVACSKTQEPSAAAPAPSAPQTCDPLWTKVEPVADAKGTGSIALEAGAAVFSGNGTFDPCFTDGCTGSNGRLRLSQDRLDGDFDATAVVESITGGDADLVFFVQSETGSDSALVRVGREGGATSVGLDTFIGDGTKSLVDRTPEGSATLRVRRAGDVVTLTAEGTKGGKVTDTAHLPGLVRVGVALSSSETGGPVTARIAEVRATGAVKPDSFDCARFRPLAAGQ